MLKKIFQFVKNKIINPVINVAIYIAVAVGVGSLVYWTFSGLLSS
jgi:hypothetical protein